MEKITQKDIDWLLHLNRSGLKDTPEAETPKLSRRLLRLAGWALLILLLLSLPFFLLIRMSVTLYTGYGFSGWFSLLGGILSTVLLLLIYIGLLFRRSTNKRALFKYSLAGLLLLVSSFSLYGVLYLSSVHAKSEAVREVYHSLHPVLRVAISTVTLADGDLIITDIQRQPEDYLAMGIPLNERSLHFLQPSGYVHAIDLRTLGRNEFRNFVLRYSIELMGFQTVRHKGTADHLHVALPHSY